MKNTWTDLPLEVCVVSLERAQHRRSRVVDLLSDIGVKYTIFDSIDGDDVLSLRNAFICTPEGPSRIYVERQSPLISNRELACSLSHMRAIRHAYERGLQNVLIFEDDIEIGNVSPGEISAIAGKMPPNASYIQLALLPAATIEALAEHYITAGVLFLKKKSTQPTLFCDSRFSKLRCHSAAAYIITKVGMQNICKKYFQRGSVVFPCFEHEVQSNVGLVADRFVYQAASGPDNPGYACCVPLLTSAAHDSLLHPDHVAGHEEARHAVEFYRMLISEKRLFFRLALRLKRFAQTA